VANLTNNKDVFMCILRFHARAGYLQTYETLLKEIRAMPGSDGDAADRDQYDVECVALADRNLNVPCESGVRYPSLIAIMNRHDMLWRMAVTSSVITLHIPVYIMYILVITLHIPVYIMYILVYTVYST
jgi:hypothetical protein